MGSAHGDAACEEGVHDDDSTLVCLGTLIAQVFFPDLAERSVFISAQLDCIEEGGDFSQVKVPAGPGRLWVRCLVRAPAALQGADNGRLASFLKASAFFQDESTVKMLSGILGSRLHHANCSEQPACNRETMIRVLVGLPVDLAMEVLRSMPGPFLSYFMHLPDSVKPVAALAEHPTLAAACMTPFEGSHTDSALPSVILCIDTGAGTEAIPPCHSDTTMHGAETSQDMANAAIWVQSSPESEGVVGDLFALAQRAGAVACRLLARSTTLQDLTIELPDNTCIVFGAGTLHLKNVTIQGGAVVCMGSSCCVTFEDCVFRRCGLVVLAGAQTTLVIPQFQCMDASTHGLSVCANGPGSHVVIQDGSIVGGVQGVVVQAGARLEAFDVTLTMFRSIGVEVKEAGSCIALTRCSIVCEEKVEPIALCGVLVQSCSSAHLSEVCITHFCYGVMVNTKAAADLADCKVSQAEESCVQVCGRGTGCLERCTVSRGSEYGIIVCDPGSRVDAAHCHVSDNGTTGVYASENGWFHAVSCTSSSNGATTNVLKAGYQASYGGLVELTDCCSDGDSFGCVALAGGKVFAHKVSVSRCTHDGFLAAEDGQAVLRECSSTECGDSGMYAAHDGSKVDAEGCTLSQNGSHGVHCNHGAVAVVRGSCSSGNKKEGYKAGGGAQMVVNNSSSDGDGGGGYGVSAGGKLTMVEVKVDGVCKSCELP